MASGLEVEIPKSIVYYNILESTIIGSAIIYYTVLEYTTIWYSSFPFLFHYVWFRVVQAWAQGPCLGVAGIAR